MKPESVTIGDADGNSISCADHRGDLWEVWLDSKDCLAGKEGLMMPSLPAVLKLMAGYYDGQSGSGRERDE